MDETVRKHWMQWIVICQMCILLDNPASASTHPCIACGRGGGASLSAAADVRVKRRVDCGLGDLAHRRRGHPRPTDRLIDERKLTLITYCHNLWMRYHSHLSSSFFLYMGTWLHTSYIEVMASFNFLYGALLHSDMTSVKCTSDLGASSIHSVRGCPLPSVTITQHKLGSKVVWWVPWGSLKQ